MIITQKGLLLAYKGISLNQKNVDFTVVDKKYVRKKNN